jgi:hypothetical protein
MNNSIETIVKNIVKHTPSGEEFFNILDEEIKKDKNIVLIKNSLKRIDKNCTLVLSGGFGLKIVSYIKEHKIYPYSYILLSGSIRKNGTTKFLEKSNNINNNLIFFDDSFYSGGTFKVIKKYLKSEYNLSLNNVFVIYDGNKNKYPFVKSLYRYFDNF